MEINALKFFAEQGISRSEAQHLSNVATKQAQFLEKKLRTLNFIDSSFTKDGEKMILKQSTSFDKDQIKKDLKQIGLLYGFVAWIREAVKAEEKFIKFYSSNNASSVLNVYEFEEYQNLKKEKMQMECNFLPLLKEEDITDKFDIGQLSNYLLSESYAAHIGKFVHEESYFQNLLKNMISVEPTSFITRGNTDYVVSNTLSVSVDDFMDFLIELQGDHRKNEKEVNRYKAIIKDDLAAGNLDIQNKNIHFRNDFDAKYLELTQKINGFEKIVAFRCQEEISAFRKLKIVVPKMFNILVDDLRK